MVDQTQVLNWLNAGAIWKDGVLLFKQINGNKHPFLTLIRKGGNKNKYQVLKQALAIYANKPTPKLKLREEFTFLNEPNVPAELKVLASDKITAYYAYTTAHAQLFNCTNNAEQLAAAAAVVENFIKNRKILAEMHHYQKTGTVLGKHQVFKLLKRVREFKAMKFMDLVQVRKNIEHAIWRINSEITKADKPHLLTDRLASVKSKEQELFEIDRILDRHA